MPASRSPMPPASACTKPWASAKLASFAVWGLRTARGGTSAGGTACWQPSHRGPTSRGHGPTCMLALLNSRYVHGLNRKPRRTRAHHTVQELSRLDHPVIDGSWVVRPKFRRPGHFLDRNGNRPRSDRPGWRLWSPRERVGGEAQGFRRGHVREPDGVQLIGSILRICGGPRSSRRRCAAGGCCSRDTAQVAEFPAPWQARAEMLFVVAMSLTSALGSAVRWGQPNVVVGHRLAVTLLELLGGALDERGGSLSCRFSVSQIACVNDESE
ncbi:hypothetical protein LAUMK13_05459 [Mycobacterium innocens]|uniref:Uncharacterized protein n=1 Tax=Mycobacterium innocens TaxID=2341083 RepID=A0A498QHY7_9MYCO|nr:hypothetical protein LAUMK13_05459 [Mycobacterium innocens]